MSYSFEVSVTLHDGDTIFEEGLIMVNDGVDLVKEIVDCTSAHHYGCQSVRILSIIPNA